MRATPEEIDGLYKALAERDEVSWERAWRTWAPRVASWVRRHPQFRYTGEEVEYFVGRAFEKLWRGVDAEKIGRLEAPSQLLQYLKLCVHGAVIDELRGQRTTGTQVESGDAVLQVIPDPAPGVESVAIDRSRRKALWAIVASHIQTPQDRALVEAALVRGLPPREIASRYGGLFANVQDVYRTKRNLLDRLSRDSRLQSLL